MRWMLTTVLLLASLTPAFADEAVPARAIAPAFSQLPPPQPVNFDLIDMRQEQRTALLPKQSDVDDHTHFITKQHLGVAAGYDNGTVHGGAPFAECEHPACCCDLAGVGGGTKRRLARKDARDERRDVCRARRGACH